MFFKVGSYSDYIRFIKKHDSFSDILSLTLYDLQLTVVLRLGCVYSTHTHGLRLTEPFWSSKQLARSYEILLRVIVKISLFRAKSLSCDTTLWEINGSSCLNIILIFNRVNGF